MGGMGDRPPVVMEAEDAVWLPGDGVMVCIRVSDVEHDREATRRGEQQKEQGRRRQYSGCCTVYNSI